MAYDPSFLTDILQGPITERIEKNSAYVIIIFSITDLNAAEVIQYASDRIKHVFEIKRNY